MNLFKKYQEGTPLEEILERLSENGSCPNLLNDDAGHWALAFDGMQSVVENLPEDVETFFFVEKEDWKDSVREAVLWGLREL